MIVDFFYGREILPTIGNFDIKMFCFQRMCIMMIVLLDLSMLVHDYQQKGEINATASLVAAFQCFYAMNLLFNEV